MIETIITQRNGDKHRILVDDIHGHFLKDYNFCVYKDKNTYYAIANVKRNGKHTTMSLHRLIMGLELGDKRVVDHLDHNGLNNTSSNLEIKTNHENSLNHKLSKKNKSGTTGVYWDKRDNIWKAQLRFKGVCYHLGSFKEKDDAIKARKTAEVKYFGENSYDACQSKNNVSV